MSESPGSPADRKRLHLNRGRYCGERIPAAPLLAQLRKEAERTGWRTHRLIPANPHPVWRFFRPGVKIPGEPRRIYISAGVHGDEPAGPMAALRLMQLDRWPANAEVTLFPCLNPTGLERNQREGAEGSDLNRDYRNPRTPLVQAHVNWLKAQPDFDIALLLHEDWEADGFYLYELASVPAGALAETIIDAVSRVCPILRANRADDWPAGNGVVRPNLDPRKRPDWPEALFLAQEKTSRCYTFEAPSDYPMDMRVAALVEGVRAAMSI